MRFRIGMLLAASIVLAPLSFARADGPVYTIPTAPDFSSMKFMLGTWHCTSKSARRPSAVNSTMTFSMDPTGFYLVQDVKTDASPWFPHATASKSLITYDPEVKQWGEMDSSDVGGYSLETSKGWNGNVLVWHLVNNDPEFDVASSSDVTITKVSDTSVTNASSFATKTGATVGVTGSCTKG